MHLAWIPPVLLPVGPALVIFLVFCLAAGFSRNKRRVPEFLDTFRFSTRVFQRCLGCQEADLPPDAIALMDMSGIDPSQWKRLRRMSS